MLTLKYLILQYEKRTDYISPDKHNWPLLTALQKKQKVFSSHTVRYPQRLPSLRRFRGFNVYAFSFPKLNTNSQNATLNIFQKQRKVDVNNDSENTELYFHFGGNKTLK